MANTSSDGEHEIKSMESSDEVKQSKDKEIKKSDLGELLKVLQETGILGKVPDLLSNWSTESSRRVLLEWTTILFVVICASLLCYIGRISGEMTAVLFSAIIGYILGKKV
jgi:hypothetical protein